MTQSKDYYKILGVGKDASDDDIKKKYYQLAKKFHPDKNPAGNAEEKFKEIGKAYDALRDAESRRTYDLQRRGEEMEARADAMAKNPTKFTFSTGGGGGGFRSNFGGFGFTADDLNDVFRRTFRESKRNKENTRPPKFGRPEWDNNFSSSTENGADGPTFTFTFSSGGCGQNEPRSRSSRMGGMDDLFDDFFHDPFFMDSWATSSNEHESAAHSDHHASPGPSRAQRADPEENPRAARAKEEALRKAARDEAQKKTREEAQRNAAREEAARKAEEDRMYDWQNGLFGKAHRGEEEMGPNTKYADDMTWTTNPTYECPTGMKLTCNYCQNKFHPAALNTHEKACRLEYYGNKDREEETPSPPPAQEEPFSASSSASSSTRHAPPRSQSFNARGGGAGAERSFKDDLLRNAYRAATLETFAQYNPQPQQAPPEHTDMVQCEWCGQSFSGTVAKYHIPFCGRKHGTRTTSSASASARPTSSASASTSANGSSGARRAEFSAPADEPNTYRSTYTTAADEPNTYHRPSYRSTHTTAPAPPRHVPQGPRPSPAAAAAAAAAATAGATGFDRINSPSFTNLGVNTGRSYTSTTADYNYASPDHVYVSPSYTGNLGRHSPSGLDPGRLSRSSYRSPGSYHSGSLGGSGYTGLGRMYGSIGRTELNTDFHLFDYVTRRMDKMFDEDLFHEPHAYTTPLSSRVGRTSASTTRIRYVPAGTTRMRGRTRVGK